MRLYKLIPFLLALLAAPVLAAGPGTEPHSHAETVREVSITVKGGYQPSRIQAAPGEKLRLRFTRHEEGSCTREVVFPTFDLRRELPPHEEVVIEITAPAEGEIPFHCGMKMIKGAIVVSAG